jgi:hypothetical protein
MRHRSTVIERDCCRSCGRRGKLGRSLVWDDSTGILSIRCADPLICQLLILAGMQPPAWTEPLGVTFSRRLAGEVA